MFNVSPCAVHIVQFLLKTGFYRKPLMSPLKNENLNMWLHTGVNM